MNNPIAIQETCFFAVFIDNSTEPFVRESDSHVVGFLPLLL